MAIHTVDTLLLDNLVRNEKAYASLFARFLDEPAQHSQISLAAYAAVAPGSVSRAVIGVAGSFAGADDALRRYVGSVEAWHGRIDHLLTLERDYASGKPYMMGGLEEMETTRKAVIRRGLEARCRAMVECGRTWEEMGRAALRILEGISVGDQSVSDFPSKANGERGPGNISPSGHIDEVKMVLDALRSPVTPSTVVAQPNLHNLHIPQSDSELSTPMDDILLTRFPSPTASTPLSPTATPTDTEYDSLGLSKPADPGFVANPTPRSRSPPPMRNPSLSSGTYQTRYSAYTMNSQDDFTERMYSRHNGPSMKPLSTVTEWSKSVKPVPNSSPPTSPGPGSANSMLSTPVETATVVPEFGFTVEETYD